jgi:heat-inducible transcriptional repressor
MERLTDRQIAILKCLIEEYIDSGEPVGSENLERKYNLGVSPATIRNEMTFLTQQGYLKKPHASAGRIPTSMALKFYVAELMEEKQLSVKDEVAAKEWVWDYRHNFGRLLAQATRALALQSRSVSIAHTNQGHLYSSGFPYILDLREFFDIDVTRQVLSLVDEFNRLDAILSKAMGEEPVHVLFGEDLQEPFLETVGFVFTDFEVGSELKGRIGVVGPARFHYSQVIPQVRYFGQLIEEIARD